MKGKYSIIIEKCEVTPIFRLNSDNREDAIEAAKAIIKASKDIISVAVYELGEFGGYTKIFG